MSNGKPWTEAHTATLKAWGGKIPAARIAAITGHAEITVRKRLKDAGIDAYRADRSPLTRRGWLLASAAGLDFQISEVGT